MELAKRVVNSKRILIKKRGLEHYRLLDTDGMRISPYYVFVSPYQIIRVDRRNEN